MLSLDENVPFAGFSKNLRLANDEVDLVLATEYGPRIMRYGARGGPNLFGEISPEVQGNDTPFGDRWHIYGGHRLWHAPEDAVRTYWPDNVPVKVTKSGRGDGVTLTQVVEPHTHLEKSIEVQLAPTGTTVSLVHRLVNRGPVGLDLCVWALSVMARGGRAIFPQAPFVPHPTALAPARPVVLWPFTRMNDARWTWGDRFITLRQDPQRTEPQKVGFHDRAGWMAYQLGETLFVKRHQPREGAHADLGCNVETFTNEAILELETLSPLVHVPPGGELLHAEQWSLHLEADLGESEGAMAETLARLGIH